MKRNFTEAFLRKLEPPTDADRRWVYDTGQPGLCVMVTATGRKTFYVYRRIRGGKPVRIKGPSFPDAGVDTARVWAREKLTDLDKGVDPCAELRKRRNQVTLATAWDHYLARHLEPHRRPATIRESKRIWEKHIKTKLGGFAIANITSEDISTLHIDIGKANGQVMANRVFEFVRRLINWAREFKTLNCNHIVNPCNRKEVTQYDETEGRERVLSKEEGERLSKVLATEQDGDLVDFLTLLAETGQRRNTVASARWNQIDLAGGRWIIPNWQTKNRRTQTVPLTKPAVEILKRRASEAEQDAEFVFTKRHFQRGWERVRKAAGLDDVWFHDFRRTLGTNLAARKEDPKTIAKVLGHAEISMVARYVHPADESVQKAVNRVSGSIISKPVSKPKAKKRKVG